MAVPPGSCPSRPVYTALGSATINTLTATSIYTPGGFGSQTVDPSNLYQGASYRFRASGLITTGALNVSGCMCSLKFGATTVGSVSTSALQSSLTTIYFYADVITRVLASGASGSLFCGGRVVTIVSGSPSFNMIRQTTSLDLSGSLFLDAMLAFTTALTGAPTITVDDAKIEQTS